MSHHPSPVLLGRRRFLEVAAAFGAVLAVPLDAAIARRGEVAESELTDWIFIDQAGTVTLGLCQPEVGQGSYTVLPSILAEELDADWPAVAVRWVMGRDAYKIQFRNEKPSQKEGASTSTTKLYARLRTAGAAARIMLVSAAATRWGVPPGQCETRDGWVHNRATGEKLAYGTLAPDAAKLPVPSDPPLKDRSAFRLIGKSLPRRDTAAKTNGSAIFGLDVTLPDMLNAAIRIAPAIGGWLVDVRNEAEVLKQPGVRHILKLDDAVIAVADRYWQAQRAVDLLDVVFSAGENGHLSTALIDNLAEAGLEAEIGVPALSQGDALKIIGQHPDRVIESRFSVPHLAHAAMEPMNATVHVQKDRVDVWGSIQSTDATVSAVAKICGMHEDQVHLHVGFLGGSFGGKIVPAFVAQAAKAAKALGRPVKLIRTREMDIQHDHFRPNNKGRLRAVLDADGYPLAVHARVCGQSLFATTRPYWLTKTPLGDYDESMVDGLYQQTYAIPNFHVDVIQTPLPIPVYFMRSVGSSAGVLFWESFITDLAHHAGIDQYAYRRHLLRNYPAGLRVLDAAAQAAGWDRPAGPDIARGIAFNTYFGRGGSFVSECAEVVELKRVGDRWKVARVVCAMDAGLVVNHNTFNAQIQGGVGFALTSALKSEITFRDGAAEQSNFVDYPLLSIAEMPEIVPVIVESDRPPQGAGEIMVAPLAPAISQALLHATGRRPDRMPFRAEWFQARA
ncbi:xanthine dehydrogenase family protein molybdopterin-binding subunit [Gluconacetobacter asukensis]|uniref:Xanthine dehydrogenase family protein molybdopterin-binding subunit n=1 Tax=Gluconacetobacter asukensis TaxID=1017181 RepID=A0A7W4IYK2_9PROT|nr:molybdopterin cofactor-binding domain-containing protein [Gluconacetobacter asukensis]MBB2171439.1 xanthine dehydrogenase family protein molybdopterin-binding subunit [Gluconacetobacter asukensis]